MECEPWQGPEKSQRKLAWPSPWDWMMAPSVFKDSRMHFSLITPISSILGPHQPLKAQLCTSGILGLFLPIVCSSLWYYPQYRTKETLLYVTDHLQFRLDFKGECRERFLLSWRASLCSCHAGGIEVHRRIQSYQCPLPTWWKRDWPTELNPQKRAWEFKPKRPPEKMRTGDRPIRTFPRSSLTNLDGDSSKETLDSLKPPREKSFFHSRFHSRLRGRRT